jgi:hypothetical protein
VQHTYKPEPQAYYAATLAESRWSTYRQLYCIFIQRAFLSCMSRDWRPIIVVFMVIAMQRHGAIAEPIYKNGNAVSLWLRLAAAGIHTEYRAHG